LPIELLNDYLEKGDFESLKSILKNRIKILKKIDSRKMGNATLMAKIKNKTKLLSSYRAK
jgi:hypothetical protein